MNSKHYGLLTFSLCGIGLTVAVLIKWIGVPVYVATVGFAWLLGKTIAHWQEPGELKLSLWEDIGIVWKIRERAEFVAAKAEEMHILEEKLRQVSANFVEASYLALYTKNLFPPPEFILDHINLKLDELAVFAKPNQEERDRWIGELRAQIEAAQRG